VKGLFQAFHCSLKIEYPATQIHHLPCRKASDNGGRAKTACGKTLPELFISSGRVYLVKTITSKAQSGKRPTEKRLLVSRFAMTAAVIMILLSSHSFTQWGQLGAILGGV